MLQTQVLSTSTLELLTRLCGIDHLGNFGLVGGTNLALRYGHRLSIDLDFFTTEPFEPTEIISLLEKTFRDFELLFQRNQTLILEIESVRVDFVLYPFPWLHPPTIIDGVRLVSVDDIIPMKLQGMENRQSKKDFWDLACLLNHYSLPEMFQVMMRKFPFVDAGHLVHALTFFDEADQEPDPISLDTSDWETIKMRLVTAAMDYTKSFLR